MTTGIHFSHYFHHGSLFLSLVSPIFVFLFVLLSFSSLVHPSISILLPDFSILVLFMTFESQASAYIPLPPRSPGEHHHHHHHASLSAATAAPSRHRQPPTLNQSDSSSSSASSPLAPLPENDQLPSFSIDDASASATIGTQPQQLEIVSSSQRHLSSSVSLSSSSTLYPQPDSNDRNQAAELDHLQLPFNPESSP